MEFVVDEKKKKELSDSIYKSKGKKLNFLASFAILNVLTVDVGLILFMLSILGKRGMTDIEAALVVILGILAHVVYFLIYAYVKKTDTRIEDLLKNETVFINSRLISYRFYSVTKDLWFRFVLDYEDMSEIQDIFDISALVLYGKVKKFTSYSEQELLKTEDYEEVDSIFIWNYFKDIDLRNKIPSIPQNNLSQ